MYAEGAGPLSQLVALLRRVEDLSHVLLWSHSCTIRPDGEQGRGGGGSGGGGGGGGGEEEVEEAEVGLVELPRLRLAFQSEKAEARSGEIATRLCSINSPGLHVGRLHGSRPVSHPHLPLTSP